MEKYFSYSSHLIVFFVLIFPEAATGVTLSEAYQAALKVAASVQDQNLRTKLAEANYKQSRGGLLPSLRAISSNEWNDNPSPFAQGGYLHTARINAKQPLFQGGAEYYALAGAQLEIANAKLATEWEEWQVYENVSNLYLDIVQIEHDIKNLSDQVELLEKRGKVVQNRTTIGRSSTSELSALLSQVARIRADLLLRRSELTTKRNEFAYWTGLGAQVALKNQLFSDGLPQPNIQEKDVLNHPALRLLASQKETRATEIKQAKSDYLPSVDLEGNYYLERQGFNQDSKWDVTVNVTWEFFSGLTTKHEVVKKNLERSIVDNQLEDTKRKLLTQWKNLEQEVRDRRATVLQLRKAVKLAKQAFNQQKQDFERGLLSNLELMRSADELLQVKRSHDREAVDLDRTALSLLHLGGKRL